MKKTLFTATLASLLSAPCTAQTAYLETSFNDGMPPTFATYDLDRRTPAKDMQKLGFEVGKGWIVADEGHEGNRAAMATSYYDNSGAANDWLVTPAIHVASAKAVLRWRSRAQAQDFRDGLKVYIGQQGNTPDDFAGCAPVFSVAKENYEWTDHELSLADYEGQEVYVAFVNDSHDMQCIIVDDIFAGVPATVGFTLDFGRCYNGQGDITVSGTAYACTDEPIDEFTIGFKAGGQLLCETFHTPLAKDRPQPFRLATPFHLACFESTDYTAWISSGPDSVGLQSRVTAAPRKIVVEEMTGTWCQFCVRGMGAMNYLAETYPDEFIGIALHNNSHANHPDSMAIPGEAYLQWMMSQYGLTGFPSCVVNRRADYAGDPMNLPAGFEAMRREANYDMGLLLEATYDEHDRRIDAGVSILPVKAASSSDLRLLFVVIENDVHRTHAETGIDGVRCGYDQLNAYAGSAEECYGFENMPKVISADDIWYQEVARATVPADDFSGLRDVFPKEMQAETIYACSHSFTMPATVLNPWNVEVVAMLIDKDGHVVNADKSKLATHFPNAIRSTVSTPSAPAIYNLQGQRLSHPARGLYISNGKKLFQVRGER